LLERVGVSSGSCPTEIYKALKIIWLYVTTA
jgi:hypothetical protein